MIEKSSIKEACHITTGKLDSNEFVEEGEYPFFTCAKNPSRIDTYAFDTSAILVAGNNANGNFHVNRYSGKFNAYQRTYVLTGKDGFNLDYVYYALKLLLLKLKERSQGSQTKFLTINLLRDLEFEKRTLADQTRISHILSTLDAKIELNNRINQELEGLAKLLYDYWFVQFDFPISAEQAAAMGDPTLQGKPYRQSGGKMTYNPTLKREIPVGWEVGTLSNIAQITMGQSPPGESYNLTGEGTLFFQGSTDFGIRFPSARQYTSQPTRYAKEGDILLSVRAPVGTMNVAPKDCAIGRGLAALRSKTNHDTYLWSVMSYFKQIFDRRNTDGTTFGSINKDDLHSLQVVLPDPDVVESFEAKVRAGNAMIANNQKQNQELATLRDWLLPMLMNGQVTVAH